MIASLARWRLLRDRLAERPGAWAGILVLGFVATALVSARLGAMPLSSADVVRALVDAGHPMRTVIWEVRLPRIATGALVGASLAAAGVLLQTAVRNPLADPGLIGISAGAGVAALLAIVLIPDVGFLLPALAFAGALGAAAFVLAASWKGALAAGPLRLILSGVAIQSILFAAIAAITFLFADRAPAFVAFTVGSLAGAGWRDAAIVAATTAIGMACALASVRPLNLLLLDDDAASGVGLGVRRSRIAATSTAALLAAGAVSVAGLVGFVGLVVPNAIRLLVGPEHGRLLTLSCIGGAILVLVADAVARIVVPPLELPVGAFLAAIGGPYFLWLLWRKSL